MEGVVGGVGVGGEELRALALISLGTTEFWAAGEDPECHLEMGVALARRIRRPFLEFTGLAYQTAAGIYQSFTRAAERGRQAIELAERHGWADEPTAGLAYVILGAMLAWQMRPGEARPWRRRADRLPGRRAAGRTPDRTAHAPHADTGTAAAHSGAPRRRRARRAGPRRPQRPRPRPRGDAHRCRGAAACPRRPARGAGRGRAGPGRLRTGSLAGLAG